MHNRRHNRIQILPYTKHNRKHNRIILSTMKANITLISGLILSTIGGTKEGTIEIKYCLNILSTIGCTIESY